MTAPVKVGHLIFVIVLASLLFMSGLDSIGLTDRDEGRNAEAGREMFETGDWITPTFNYEPRFIKPAMLYWLMSGAYWVFGVNEFAARFPSALFGVALVALQYLFLAKTRGSGMAWVGALMLLLNIEVIALARQALTDMVLMFFTTLATYSFWLGFQGSTSRRAWFMVCYAAMAAGTLVKGPPGFLVPLLGIIPYLAITRQWRRFWNEGLPLGGMVIFLALALPWYASMLMLHGDDYTAQAQEHTLRRYLNPFYGWGGTPLFYLPVLLFGFFPWSGFLASALYEQYKAWRARRRSSGSEKGEGERWPAGDLELFAALWCTAVFVFFSLGATRLPHYIGPLYPAAAIVTAGWWDRVKGSPTPQRLRVAAWIVVLTGAAMALVFAVLPFVFDAFAEKLMKSFPYADRFQFGPGPSLSVAVLLLGMGVMAYWLLWARNPKLQAAFGAAAATLTVLALITLHVTLPQLNRYLIAPPQQLASLAGSLLAPHDRLIFYGPHRPSAVFYAKRKVVVIHRNEEENVTSFLKEPGRTLIVLPASMRERLPGEVQRFPVIQERFGWILVGPVS